MLPAPERASGEVGNGLRFAPQFPRELDSGSPAQTRVRRRGTIHGRHRVREFSCGRPGPWVRSSCWTHVSTIRGRSRPRHPARGRKRPALGFSALRVAPTSRLVRASARSVGQRVEPLGNLHQFARLPLTCPPNRVSLNRPWDPASVSGRAGEGATGGPDGIFRQATCFGFKDQPDELRSVVAPRTLERAMFPDRPGPPSPARPWPSAPGLPAARGIRGCVPPGRSASAGRYPAPSRCVALVGRPVETPRRTCLRRVGGTRSPSARHQRRTSRLPAAQTSFRSRAVIRR
jgi:hypothetical protein